jgi:hypothetical protein
MRPHLLLVMGCAILANVCDPVRSNEVATLGGEAPGVPHGPLHRPGQPCLLCHGNFSVAGTVFVDPTNRNPAAGVTVNLTDSQGHVFSDTTNAAGNFFVRPAQFTPVYPMKVALQYDGMTVNMTADVGRDGACAMCHSDPVTPSSPGHVYTPADGGTP